MRVGNAHELEHGLDRAVLAAAAVKRVEHAVGRRRQRGEERAQVARHVDAAHVIAQGFERARAFAAADQRDLALGGPAAHQHRDALRHGRRSGARGAADAADFPFERDAARVADAAAHLLAQRLDVGGGGLAGIDEEIRVLLRHHRAAHAQAAAARLVDQLPRLAAGRIGEGRAAGARTNGLSRLARRLDLRHAPADRVAIARHAAKPRRDENPILGHAAMAIGKAHLRGRERVAISAAIERHGLFEHILELAAIGAAIHAQSAADGAGNAGHEFEPGDASQAASERDVEVERAGAGLDDRSLGLDLDEAAAEAHHHAWHAAVAHQEVRGDADHGDRHVLGLCREERGEVVAIGGAEHHFRRPADAEPGDAGERRVRGEPPAHRRQAVDQVRLVRFGGHHARTPRFIGRSVSSSPGSALAHCVIEPAPRQTTKSPGWASAAICGASSAGEASASTLRWPRARRPATSASRFTPSIGASPAG